MRKQILQLLLPAIAGGFVLAGCAHSHQSEVRQPPTPDSPCGETIIVDRAPAPRRELVEENLKEEHVWVTGAWAYPVNSWVWFAGHWELRPQSDAVWVPAHWDKNPSGGGSFWNEGHWE